MGFLGAIRTFFHKCFDFRGRASRSEFWYVVLFLLLVSSGLSYLDALMFDTPVLGFVKNPIGGIFGWITLPASLALGWRRLHDIGRSGWWIGSGFLWFVFTFCVALGLALLVTNAVKTGDTEFLETLKPFQSSIEMFAFITKWSWLPWCIILLVFFCLPSKGTDNRFDRRPHTDPERSLGPTTPRGPVEYIPPPAFAAPVQY